jgi:hypothetical protein
LGEPLSREMPVAGDCQALRTESTVSLINIKGLGPALMHIHLTEKEVCP